MLNDLNGKVAVITGAGSGIRAASGSCMRPRTSGRTLRARSSKNPRLLELGFPPLTGHVGYACPRCAILRSSKSRFDERSGLTLWAVIP